MSGPTFSFVGFGIVVALLVSAHRSTVWRQWVILVASLLFLASFSRDPLALLPLAGFLLAGYVALRVVERRPELAGSLSIVAILALFAWIKRYAFIPSAAFLPGAYVTVGMSYILFRLLHLIIETRGDPGFARLSAREYLVYLIGFNTLVAGPIAYVDEFFERENEPGPTVTLPDVGEAVSRIIVGLFKTNVLAAILVAARAGTLATLLRARTMTELLVSAVAVFVIYPFFLYCNFSGYIDIVVGIGLLMGQRLPENFDRPFAATSFIDFWNRWHITLSRWLKRYVYNPLLVTLMRRYPARGLELVWATLAFFITFFLVGAWHGQTTAFLFFGVLQGLGVSVNKLYQIMLTKRLGRQRYGRVAAMPAYRAFARGLTFTWFTFTLSWFWGSWSELAKVESSMSIKKWAFVWLGIFLGSSFALEAWESVRSRAGQFEWHRAPRIDALRVRTAWLTTLLVVVVIVVLVTTTSAPEIIYKDF